MNKENYTGIKHDDGKPRFSLVPPLAELEVVKVLSFGAEKYAPDNWRGIDPIRYVDAAGRHTNAYRRGETADEESGLHHLAHAICCLMFQLEKALESEQGNTSQSRDATPRRRRVTASRKKRKTAAQEPHPTPAGTFSAKELPMIGQDYYYISNTGVLTTRRWQSTPQEWKRLAAGQVFKTSEACTDAEHTGTYIFHEDDPAPYPEARKLYWYVGLERDTTTWMALCIYYPDDWKKGMELANEIHGRGTAAMSEEHAKAKAYCGATCRCNDMVHRMDRYTLMQSSQTNPFLATMKVKHMSDLSDLAEIMDRLSKNPNDYHSQAASALRELHQMKTEVHRLSEVWHQQCSGWPDTGDEMLSIGTAVDRLDVIVRNL